MAKGRMVNTKIGASLKIHSLSNDTCRLFATWTISHLDKHGVFHGEPALLRSYVFPRRGDVSLDQIEGFLQEMQQIGLIVLFEARGERWQFWPGFADEQAGLRPERETTSFPNPPIVGPVAAVPMPEPSRNDDGTAPAEKKGNEGKRKEGAAVAASPPEPTAAQSMFEALAGAYRWDYKLLTEKQRGRLNREEKQIREKGYTTEDVMNAGVWWWDNDWRGKKGSPPSTSQFFETLAQRKANAEARKPRELEPWQ